MQLAKHLILEAIPNARSRQNYGKHTFTEAGEVAEDIRIARELLGQAKKFDGVNELRRTWIRSQFVRMPDGTRDNGMRQAVYFSTRRW